MNLLRRSPMKRSAGTRWPDDVREAIRRRDNGRCVCALAGFPLDVIRRCIGFPVELDHVRASGGLGMKSRSTVDNGVCLSRTCHDYKTNHGREVRPLLLAYIAEREADAA